MNKETVQLLESLAKKLGTTAEYLWQVLLRQAPIYAATTLAQFIIIMVFGYVLLKFHLDFSKETLDKHGYKETIYEDNESTVWIMVVLGVLWVFLFLIVFCSLGDVVNGFFNPEYWALKQIINT